jgi:hypothetical protein
MIRSIIINNHNQMDLNVRGIHTVKTRKHKLVPAKKTKHVSFAPDITVLGTMGLDDYKMAEIYSTWYTEDDLLRISKECFVTLEKNLNQIFLRESESMRGLEPHSPIESILRQKSRQTSIDLVLEEQRRQLKEKGVVDVDSLYKVYHNTTSSSQMWAQVIGNHDHDDAELYLDEDDIECIVYPIEQPAHNSSRVTRNEVMSRAA